eukprot:TRINITY_DN676_c0_g7_i1.p1 TRINITY_DN676_c0_g7~~TRINITY_DN676_c0_g7_i1.p1  ORF type:complete len:921 (-),score=205.41 TRINITY_DN676_c0_g7_i1:24-2786(-)
MISSSKSVNLNHVLKSIEKEPIKEEQLHQVVKYLSHKNSSKVRTALQILDRVTKLEVSDRLVAPAFGCIPPLVEILSTFSDEKSKKSTSDEILSLTIEVLANLTEHSPNLEKIAPAIPKIVNTYFQLDLNSANNIRKKSASLCLEILRRLSRNELLRSKILREGIDSELLPTIKFKMPRQSKRRLSFQESTKSCLLENDKIHASVSVPHNLGPPLSSSTPSSPHLHRKDLIFGCSNTICDRDELYDTDSNSSTHEKDESSYGSTPTTPKILRLSGNKRPSSERIQIKCFHGEDKRFMWVKRKVSVNELLKSIGAEYGLELSIGQVKYPDPNEMSDLMTIARKEDIDICFDNPVNNKPNIYICLGNTPTATTSPSSSTSTTSSASSSTPSSSKNQKIKSKMNSLACSSPPIFSSRAREHVRLSSFSVSELSTSTDSPRSSTKNSPVGIRIDGTSSSSPRIAPKSRSRRGSSSSSLSSQSTGSRSPRMSDLIPTKSDPQIIMSDAKINLSNSHPRTNLTNSHSKSTGDLYNSTSSSSGKPKRSSNYKKKEPDQETSTPPPQSSSSSTTSSSPSKKSTSRKKSKSRSSSTLKTSSNKSLARSKSSSRSPSGVRKAPKIKKNVEEDEEVVNDKSDRRRRLSMPTDLNMRLHKKWVISIRELNIPMDIEAVGHGHFGDVRLGFFRSMKVACKFVREKCFSSKKDIDMFVQEVNLLSELRHPNVILYMGVCIDSNEKIIITEFMENGSLYDLVHNNTKNPSISFPLPNLLRIAKDISLGMNYLHGELILHRDLTSKNILLTKHFLAKVSDFGLSKRKLETSSDESYTVGSLPWMAPEVIDNARKFSRKSDVYSYGMILWELVSGKHPCPEGMMPINMATQVLQGYRPSIPDNCPIVWKELIEECWHQDFECRPTFDTIQKKLENVF